MKWCIVVVWLILGPSEIVTAYSAARVAGPALHPQETRTVSRENDYRVTLPDWTRITRDSIDFSVLGEEGNFLLRWIAPPAFSCLEYTIERTWSADYRIPDDARWLEIGKESGLCNVASSITYSFIDRAVGNLSEGSVQYRLRLRLLSGEEYLVYSEVLIVALPLHMQIIGLFPSPAVHTLSITVALLEESPLWYDIYNTSGKRVLEVAGVVRLNGIHTLHTDVSALPAGAYLLQLQSESSTELRVFHIMH
jgi:hypothetical protein